MSQPESYVGIGTPFELPENEDDFSRKKPVPIHEQVAVDVKGRRRFHGAFTGGFSAGHFNSVGSIEGEEVTLLFSHSNFQFNITI